MKGSKGGKQGYSRTPENESLRNYNREMLTFRDVPAPPLFFMQRFFCSSAIATILTCISTISTRAQTPAIQPALDGTNTQVEQNGDAFQIFGGTPSNDGANLFHSFSQFGVGTGQSATFLSSPQIQNILGRVTGGDPSIVNGLLQVTGGTSNLFLINPTGIVFGPDASLNVPASFAATTATGIEFGQNGWFDATGSGNWGDLVGNPSAFRFDRLQPGRLVNLGDLEVPAGETIDLFGGVVVNAGSLVAPEGSVNVVAVEGGNLLRLTAEGNVLGLEVEPIGVGSATATLAELLTGNAIAHANLLAVNETGEVVLSGSGAVVPDEEGDAIAAGAIDVSGEVGGNVNLLGDRVALLGTIDAFGTYGGGNVLVGGDIRGEGTIPTADFTFVGSDGSIDVSALQSGDGGTAIAWADDTTRFFGQISARGGALGGDGGFVETSGANLLDSSGTVDASAQNGLAGTWLLDPNNITIQDAGPNANVTAGPDFMTTDDSAIVTTGSIETALDAGTSVSVTTESAGANSEAGDITVADPIEKTAGTDATLTLNADRDILVNAPISSTGSALNIVLDADGGVAIDADISTNGGNFTATGATGLMSSGGHGIFVNSNRTIDAMGGNISFVGTGNPAIDGSDGVQIDSTGTLQTSGGGTISLTGTAGSGTSNNNGIQISTDAMVQSQAGSITLVGTSNGTNDLNDGITIDADSVVESVGSGAIVLTGTSGDGANNNNGIFIGSTVRTGGSITLAGTGNGSDVTNNGIFILGALEATGTGAISLSGTGGNGTNDNNGIDVRGPIESANSGAIVLTGVAGSGTNNNNGIFIGAAVQSGGSITLAGTGNGLGSGNDGIHVDAIVESTGTGTSDTVVLTGVGGNGIDSDGIFIVSSSMVQSASGSITLVGTGNGSGTDMDNDGIAVFGTIESANSGAIELIGTAGNNTDNNDGIAIVAGSMVQTDGNITLVGTTNGAGTLNRGILIEGMVESMGGGAIELTGASASGTDGIFATQPLRTSGGNIEIVAPGDDNVDLAAIDSSAAASPGGNVTVTAENVDIAYINTQSGSGDGGSVEINAGRDVRLSGSFTAAGPPTASISTIGTPNDPSTGGTILIRHNSASPFEVGNPAMNGSADVITRGSGPDSTVPPGPVPPDHSQDGGQIQILFGPPPPPPPPPSPPPPPPPSPDPEPDPEPEPEPDPEPEFPPETEEPEPEPEFPPEPEEPEPEPEPEFPPEPEEPEPEPEPEPEFPPEPEEPEPEPEPEFPPEPEEPEPEPEFPPETEPEFPPETEPEPEPEPVPAPEPEPEPVPAPADEPPSELPPEEEGAIATDIQSTGSSGAVEVSNTSDSITIETVSASGNTTSIEVGESSGGIAIETDVASESVASVDASDAADGVAIETDVASESVASVDASDAADGVAIETVAAPEEISSGAAETGSSVETIATSDDVALNVAAIDNFFTAEGSAYSDSTNEFSSELEFRQQLEKTREETGYSTGVSYVLLRPEQIDLFLVLPGSEAIYASVSVPRDEVLQTVSLLRRSLTNQLLRRIDVHLEPAQKLYQWFLAPLEPHLEAAGVDNVAFSLSPGLRSLPIAALHDGERFLIEKYGVSILPSLNLTDTSYQSLQGASVLAMGASTFEDLPPLPGAGLELSVVTSMLESEAGSTEDSASLPQENGASGTVFLNEDFTFDNLATYRKQNAAPIVHLATHAQFVPGDSENTYIHLWQEKLPLDRLRELRWYQPPTVELLVLSACQTAVGGEESELGFAGLALQTGVKSILASLWSVSDTGTLGLMGEFYENLTREDATIKAEALRQAQLALLRGEVYLEDGVMKFPHAEIALPPNPSGQPWLDGDFSHPFFWSGFTLVGSPW